MVSVGSCLSIGSAWFFSLFTVHLNLDLNLDLNLYLNLYLNLDLDLYLDCEEN